MFSLELYKYFIDLLNTSNNYKRVLITIINNCRFTC